MIQDRHGNRPRHLQEFLLRQPLEDRILNSLLRALPLANDDAHLKKMILLRKIEFEVSQNSVSESILDLFEQLEELESRKGCDTVSDAMKRAYCAVAVECTVKLLANRDDGDNSSKLKFFEAVKRVCRGRIGRMEKRVEKGGLCSGELSSWKDEIEAAVWGYSDCDSVVKKSARVNGVEVVKAYLREEREKMGHSFLELVAEAVKNGEIVLGVLGMENGGGVGGLLSYVVVLGYTQMQKKRIKLRDKLVGLRRSRGSLPRKSRGAKIVDSAENRSCPSYRNDNMPSSAEVNRVREALGSSASELHAVVEDPLPDALQFAEKISGDSRKDKDREPNTENYRFQPNLFIVDGAGVVQGTGPNVKNAPKPSLMEQNVAARDEVKNLKKRRRGRKWSLAEEDALRTGVQKYGKGNWKVILTAYHDEFDGRTEVDFEGQMEEPDALGNHTRFLM